MLGKLCRTLMTRVEQLNDSMESSQEHRQGSSNEPSQSDESRMQQLTELVSQIAQKLDQFTGSRQMQTHTIGSIDSAISSADQRRASRNAKLGEVGDTGNRVVRSPRPPQPDPRLLRRIIRQRQLRARFFDSKLFADPAWDMLLELTAARAENALISVTSLCIASGVPSTTALRWIDQMTKEGLFERRDDANDRRRSYISMTDKAANAMARFFAELDTSAARLV